MPGAAEPGRVVSALTAGPGIRSVALPSAARKPDGQGAGTNPHTWMRFDVPRRFENQGDCIQYVNTLK